MLTPSPPPPDRQLEYVTWNLPRAERDERCERTKNAAINPAALFEPSAYFLKSTSGSENSWCMFSASVFVSVTVSGFRLLTCAVKKRCSRFQATLSTRCVRDIKRDFSWKIYGVCCNQNSGVEAHYVRMRFVDKASDIAFALLSNLLNSLAAKRFLQSSRRGKVRPFGIGFDAGVRSKERCYIISNCAKQTPFLRRVDVRFEAYIEHEWKRIDAVVDRIGFATYKSAPKSAILGASTLDAISFKDDAYLRFARVTLRFGDRNERTVLDMGKNFEPQLVYTKTSTVLTLNRVRVRSCEGSNVSEPVQTQARLIFTDMKSSGSRKPFRRPSAGKHSASEAEKALALLKRTVQLAGVNTLGLADELADDAVFEMNIQRVITNAEFSIRAKGDSASTNLSLQNLFKNSTLFMVPCYDSNGVNLVLQSRDGDYVLRQYVQSPIKFIGSITSNCFSGPKFSTITKIGEGMEYGGTGKVTYMFETGETDAAALVETLVSIIEKLHTFQTTTTTTTGTTAPGSPAAVTAVSSMSLPPFISLPRIPPIPSIHLSRPSTANTSSNTSSGRLATAAATTTNAFANRPPADPTPTYKTHPRLAIVSPSVPIVTPPPLSSPTSPVMTPIEAIPPLTIYKVPRKPVPHSRSASLATSASRVSSARKPVPHSRSISLATTGPTRQSSRSPSPQPPSQTLLVPDPSTLPGGRMYELRTRTLKRVITGLETGLETGLQGSVRTVSRS